MTTETEETAEFTAYTVEFSWLVPIVVHQEIEAENPEAALVEARRMLADDEIEYDLQKSCDDGCSDTEITGLWEGECYSGPDLRSPEDMRLVDVYTAEDLDGVVEEIEDKINRRLLQPMREALKAGRDALAEALTTHIYDADNGEEPEPDCGYVATIAQMDEFLARTEGTTPVGLPVDVRNALRNASAAISSMGGQIGQIRGMFGDGDGAIEDAVEAGDQSVGEIEAVLAAYAVGQAPTAGAPGRVAVVIEGGMLQAVISDGPLIGMEIVTIDYDVDGAEDGITTPILQPSGAKADAYVGSIIIEAGDIDIPEPVPAPPSSDVEGEVATSAEAAIGIPLGGGIDLEPTVALLDAEIAEIGGDA